MDQILEVCFHKKGVVQELTTIHARFRVLMEELLWRFHPYHFVTRDGVVAYHPDLVRFQKRIKKQQQARTKSAVSIESKKKKPTKKELEMKIALETIPKNENR